MNLDDLDFYRCTSTSCSTITRWKTEICKSKYSRSDSSVKKKTNRISFPRFFFSRYYRSNEVRRFTYTRSFVHEDDRDATLDIAVRFNLVLKQVFHSICLQKFSAEKYEFSTSFPLPNTTRWVSAGPSTKVSDWCRMIN